MSTAIVTGANRGIGLGLAHRLAEKGYDVIGTVRAGSDSTELSAIAKVVTLDISDSQSIAEFGQQIDSVDLLINNAAISNETPEEAGPLDALDGEALLDLLRVNSVGPVLVTQALAPKLTKGATVVNMSSGMGSLGETQSEAIVGYSASKAALNMFTRQLSFDPKLADKIVIVMDPGWVKTRMGGKGASLTVDQSTAAIVAVIESLKQSDTGTFRRYNGDTVVW